MKKPRTYLIDAEVLLALADTAKQMEPPISANALVNWILTSWVREHRQKGG